MNKPTYLNVIGGLWLLINIPAIPFVGSVFHQISPSVHLILSIIVLITFVILSKSFSVSVVASLCVVAIALLRLDGIKNLLQSSGPESVSTSLYAVIVLTFLAICVIGHRLIKNKK
jgi:hypothetical protein